MWLPYIPSKFFNLPGAYESFSLVWQRFNKSRGSESALVPKLNSSVYSLEEFELLLAHLQVIWKQFVKKFWSLENYCRGKLRSSVRISKWKVSFPSSSWKLRYLLRPGNTTELSKVNETSQSRNFIFSYNILSCVPTFEKRKHYAVLKDISVSSAGPMETNGVDRTYKTKLTFRPVWIENIDNSIRSNSLINYQTKLVRKFRKEPTFKVHSLLYWQMEGFSEGESLPHLLHLRWKHYPKRLRKQRMEKGSHLSISKWNKFALIFSIVILRSTTDSLWFIIRPIVVEGYHILHYSIKKVLGLLWTDKNAQATSHNEELQLVLSRNFRDGIRLDNVMRDIVLSNFRSFWKFERALSKVSRKAILWGVVEEGTWTSSRQVGRQTSEEKNEFSTILSFLDEKRNSYWLAPIQVFVFITFGFILFPLIFFPTFSESLVDICTLVFRLFAVYSIGTFGFATWRIITESIYFVWLFETVHRYISILLRHSFFTTTNEVVDVAAWQVNEKEEFERYSICKHVEELWQESVCRAEVLLRRIPIVFMDSSAIGWQLLSLFEQEEDEKGGYV